MFQAGMVLLLLGGFCIYKSPWILRHMNRNDTQGVIMVKMIGMLLAFLAFWLILSGEIPQSMKFIRIFHRWRGVL